MEVLNPCMVEDNLDFLPLLHSFRHNKELGHLGHLLKLYIEVAFDNYCKEEVPKNDTFLVHLHNKDLITWVGILLDSPGVHALFQIASS